MDRAPAEYQIRTVKRRGRSLSLRVQADGIITVGTPYGASQRMITDFISRKRAWIETQLERSAQLYGFSVRPRIANGLSVRFDTGPVISAGLDSLGDVVITRPSSQADQHFRLYEAARPLIKQRLNQLANFSLAEEFKRQSRSSSPQPPGLGIKFMRSRWGSCTASGKITLNSQLMRLPIELRRYVICHELAHLKVPNHSAMFYRELERLMPGALAARKRLRGFKLFH